MPGGRGPEATGDSGGRRLPGEHPCRCGRSASCQPASPSLNRLHNSLERQLIGVAEGPCQGSAPECPTVGPGSAGSAGRNDRPVSRKCTVG